MDKDRLVEVGWKEMDNGGFTLDAHALFPEQCDAGVVWSLAPEGNHWIYRGARGSVQSALFEDAVELVLFIQGMFQDREGR